MVSDQREINNNLFISNQETSHFARQLILEDFGEKKQKILFKSHITFVGIGGINSPAFWTRCVISFIDCGIMMRLMVN